MAIRSAEINVMVSSAIKVARALARDFGELEQLQTSRSASAEFMNRSFNNGAWILQDTLGNARPKRKIMMAGSGSQDLDKTGELWLANPICGKTNFSHGIPHFAVSIAHIQHQEALATVVYDSIHDDLYWAEKGIGAFRNDRRIRVSQRRRILDAVVGNYEIDKNDKNIHKYQNCITQNAGILRILGSTSLDLAYVAAGWLDGFWSSTATPADVMSGALLVQEAGGFASGIIGTGRPSKGPGILASNGHLQSELASLFRQTEHAD